MADQSNLTITQQLAGLTVGDPRNITAQHMRDIVLSIDTKINTGVGAGDLKSDGTVSLTTNWNMGAFKMTAQQFESNIASGTPPLIVASTDRVPNLNADRVDSIEGVEILLRNGSVLLTANWTFGDFNLLATTTNTANLGSASIAMATVFSNNYQPEANVDLVLKRDDGVTLLSIKANNTGVEMAGPPIPSGSNTIDIGTTSREWRSLYLGTSIFFSTLQAAQLSWDDTQTNDHLILGVDTTTYIFLITGQDRIGSNFALGVQSQPTMFFHDGSATLTNLGSIKHDGTEFIIDNAKGDVNPVVLKSNGTDRLKVSSTGIEIFSDLLPNANNTRLIGSGSLAYAVVFTRFVQPDTGGIALRTSGSTIRFEVDSTGIGFFATTPVAKAAALTAEDATAINSTYDATEEAVLNNVRTRVGELESRLQAYGLLT